ncbi:flagellar protein FliT [Granulosicoccaceae sp. 1_MG-2023]|nr:flagellar protein FliT [Granulosicoccaceae sp. 1_MG-2023]
MNGTSDNNHTIALLHTAMQNMAAAAREQAWDRLEELDHERRRLTAMLNAGQKVSPEARRMIGEISRLDKTVLQLCAEQRDTQAAELRSLSSGRKVCAAYQANT